MVDPFEASRPVLNGLHMLTPGLYPMPALAKVLVSERPRGLNRPCWALREGLSPFGLIINVGRLTAGYERWCRGVV